MPCVICRREVTGPFPLVPAWLAPWRDHAGMVCSLVCLAIITDKDKRVIDKTENESAALEAASTLGGEYLESLGETDFTKLDRDQWMTLLEVVVTAWSDRLRELENDSGCTS